MSDRTGFIIESTQAPFATRQTIASEYAAGIRYGVEECDWRKVNAAILERWTPSGLAYIKRYAWKINASFAERAAADPERREP